MSSTVNGESNEEDNKLDRRSKCLQVLTTRRLCCSASYFALVYFIQGITNIMSGFVNLPLQTILKDTLLLSPSQTGKFFFACTIAWSIKPLYGLVSDFLPICGYHRFIYLLLTIAINFVAWLALYFGPIEYAYLLIFTILVAFSLAFNDVLIDALMISIGRPLALIGTLQGIQQTSTILASTLSQIPAGIIASHSIKFQSNQTMINGYGNDNINTNKYIFLISSICPIILFFATLVTVREPRRKLNKNNFSQTWLTLSKMFQCKRVWIIAAFLFLYSASPQMKTSLFYYQRDILKFDPFFVSIFNTIHYGCATLSAFMFLCILAHYRTKHVLRIAIVLRVLAVASYFFAKDKTTSICVAVFAGYCSEITSLAMLNLAAESCPKNIEGTLFALFVSCINFGTAVGDWIGAIVYERLGFTAVICIAMFWVGTTILATWHIGQDDIKSTLDDECDDQYHYYDVTGNRPAKVEKEESEEKNMKSANEHEANDALMI